MNLVLFEPGELEGVLPATDARVVHVRTVLRRSPGEEFDAAIADVSQGKASLLAGEAAGGARFSYRETLPCPPPEPGALLCGLCRPQTVRKVIREASAVGVGAVHFFPTERGEPSYARASLWTDGEVRRLQLEAAAQAFCARLVPVHLHASFAEALEAATAAGNRTRIALDNYEGTAPLAAAAPTDGSFCCAVGSERGWSAAERDTLRAAGFVLAHLGARVLRSETACVAALALLRSRHLA